MFAFKSCRRSMSNFFTYPLLRKAMYKEHIVPDVIDTVPREIAEAYFPSGAQVNLGNELTPLQVAHPPHIEWNAENDAFYTLCMIDPDAPSRSNPMFGQFQHWLVGNISGGRVSSGIFYSEYIGAVPPRGTGLHRYVFLVYQQRAKIQFNLPRIPYNSGKDRGNFSIRKFATEYKLGQPVAGNFFLAQWDNFVPLLSTLFEE